MPGVPERAVIVRGFMVVIATGTERSQVRAEEFCADAL